MPLALVLGLAACSPQEPMEQRLYGRVLSKAGEPLAGALVTAWDAQSQIERTVYTDRDGSYRIAPKDGKRWTIRAQYSGHAPESQAIELGEAGTPLDFVLAPDLQAIAKATGEHWLALLPDGDRRREFIINCTTCHTMSADRIMPEGEPRSVENWLGVIAKMRSMDVYGNIPADFVDQEYAEWLAGSFTKTAAAGVDKARPIDPELARRVEITEYAYPDETELPHDLVIAPDGRIWVTGFFNGDMLVLDPKTGKTRTYPVNNGDPGGDVRALKFGRDGKLWAVLGASKSLVSLDTNTGKYKSFPVGMYAHDIEIDSAGRLWLNDYFGKPERVARFDPANSAVKEYVISAKQLTKDEGLPLPYGLQVDRQDILWGSQLAANTLFRLDPRTGASEVFDLPTPNSGPRRLALGIDGTIWIPEWATGFLTGFDPGTRKFARHRLGSATIGAYDAEVDPRSGVVWVTGSLASSLIRFDPKSGQVDTIPLPTEPAFMRHLAVDPNTGDVWTAYSQLPAHKPKIVRVRIRPPANQTER